MSDGIWAASDGYYGQPPRAIEDFANSLESYIFLQKHGVSLQGPTKVILISSNLSVGISEALEGR